MYNVELLVKNMRTGKVSRKEIVPYYSLWAARCWAREVIRCTDITNVDIIDTETGEIMLSLSEEGDVVWDSEG